MELDELKYLLGETRTRSTDELSHYLKQRSNSVIQKIIRSMTLEIVFASIFGPASAVWFFITDLLFYKVIAAILAIFCAVFLFYIRKLYIAVNTHQSAQLPVKENLSTIIKIVSQFIRLYFRFTMLMLPLICLTGLFTIRADDVIKLSTWDWVFYAAWFIGWSAFMYFFTRWYLHKLYGNYLNELRAHLRQLQE